MRLSLVVALFLCAVAPVFAHDDTYGFMNCYGGKHCPQNTLVFGVITALDDDTYTVAIQKILRGPQYAQEGTQVRLLNTGWRFVLPTDHLPRLHEAIAVSYLRTNTEPYQPRYIICSSINDWREMKVNACGAYFGDYAAVEHFIQSGGVDDDFYFGYGNAYLRTHDGKSICIFTAADKKPYVTKPVTPPPAPSPPPIAAIVLVGIAWQLIATGVWVRRKQRRRK